MWKKRVDLKELFFYLRTQSEKRSSVRFVTFVGYAEFPMNLVLNILKLHLRIT